MGQRRDKSREAGGDWTYSTLLGHLSEILVLPSLTSSLSVRRPDHNPEGERGGGKGGQTRMNEK